MAKPLLWGDTRSDVERFDPKLHEAHGSDPSRIPGYSEIVQANDVAAADELTFRNHQQRFGLTGKIKKQEDVYRLIGAHPQELPVEFKWLPISGPTGGALSPTAANQLDRYTNKEGFSLVKVDLDDPATDFSNQFYGYGFPVTGRVEGDGSIRRGPDVALYVRSGEVARMWKQHYEERAREMDAAHLPESFTKGSYDAPVTPYEEERSTEYVTH